MALLEESGKHGVCFNYPIGRKGADNLRVIPISTYRKVGMYFAFTSAGLLVSSIFLLANFLQYENDFTFYASALLVYSSIRFFVLRPKMNISACKVNKVSPGPLYAICDQSCYLFAMAIMGWMLFRHAPRVQGDWLSPLALMLTLVIVVLAILPPTNSAILLMRQRSDRREQSSEK